MLGVFTTLFAVIQFFSSPLLGALSDRFGRRPVILLSNLGLALDYGVMALAPSLGWLFVGRAIAGLTSAGYAAANAYIADVTPPEQRAAAFGRVAAAFGLGFIIGPVMGGLLGQIDARLPFWVAGGLSLANWTYGLFVLPESLPVERRAAFSLARANPVGSLNLLRSHRELLGLAGANFLVQLANCVFASVWVLYVVDRYRWSPLWVGLSLAAVGVSVAVIQLGLTRRVVAVLGERRTVLAGHCCGAAGFCICGLATQGWQFMLGIPVLCLWGLASPSISSQMSRRVGPDEQGRLQGANASITSVASLFGPGLFSAVFALALGYRAIDVRGAPYLLAGAILLLATTIAWRVTAGARRASRGAD